MSTKFVVAIGYSEGGLEPLLTFFDHVPHDQATYVILRHIPIGQRSALSEILKRHSKLKILEVEDGIAIQNDIVYIPPTDSYITIKDDKLYLHNRVQESRNYNLAINVFLESLAEAKADKSIAVLLSGGGFDGAAGVTRVHEAGGLVIVQKPETCSEKGIVENAIKTGSVDHVLLPSEMPEVILKYANPILSNANGVKRLKQ